MRDFFYLGSAPSGEDCVQVTPHDDYLPAMRAECLRYIDALRTHYGPEPEGAELRIKRESHDFGSYMEVVITFDADEPEAVGYACQVENGLELWPEAA